jgi:hypothetical protein
MKPRDIRERFYEKTIPEPNTGCLLWTASRNGSGYGTFALAWRRTAMAHRFAWELERGPVPPDLEVCHHCDTPACVNTSHLFVGTTSENKKDQVRKGRWKNPSPYL